MHENSKPSELSLISLVNKGKITSSEAAEAADMSIEEFEEHLKSSKVE